MKVAAGILFLLSIIGFIWAASAGVTKAEQNECYQWAKEKSEIKGYWLADWQVTQCQSYGIKI